MRACMREARASLTRTSASSARPSVTSARSSGMGAASNSPRRKTSAGCRARPAARKRGSSGRKRHGAEVKMASLRSLTRTWLPQNFKKHFQQVLLGYHSYAPSFSSAGEDMILRHAIGSDKMEGFYVDVGAYHPVILSNTYFFYLNGWRGINLDARPVSRK